MAAPTLFAVSGSNDFLRRRAVATTVAKQRHAGWDVQVVEGTDTTGFMSALNQSAGMFGDGRPILLVVRNPDKVALPVLEGHVKNATPAVTLLLNIEGDPKGNTKFGKFIDALDKKVHQAFPLPDKKWEIPKAAMTFCVAESKRLGKPMSDDLAMALVRASGTDFGFLYFEIQKAVIHAESHGALTLEAKDVRAAMAPVGDVSFDLIKETLITRNRKTVAQSLEKIRKMTRDPIMPLCGFIEAVAMGSRTEKEGRTSFGWLHLTTLTAQGMSPDQIATALDINPYRCKTFLLPEVRAWKPDDVLSLVRATAAARRAVVNGQLDPWTVLVAGIIEVCVVR